jgi:hypothetical protein
MPSEFNLSKDLTSGVPNSNTTGAKIFGMLTKKKKPKKKSAAVAVTPAEEWENLSKYDLYSAEIANAKAELENRRELERIRAKGEVASATERAKAEARADADIRVRGHDSRVTSLDISEMTDTHIPAFLKHLGPRAFEGRIGSATIKVGPEAKPAPETPITEATAATAAPAAEIEPGTPRQFESLVTPIDLDALEERYLRKEPEALATATAKFEDISAPVAAKPTPKMAVAGRTVSKPVKTRRRRAVAKPTPAKPTETATEE